MQTRVLVPQLLSRQELAGMFVELANKMLTEANMSEVMSGQTKISTSTGIVLLQLETGLMAPTTWNVHDVIGLMNDDAGVMGDDVPEHFFSIDNAEDALSQISGRLEDASVRAGNEVFERMSDFNLNIESLMSARGIKGYEALLAKHGEGFRAFVAGFGTCDAFLGYVKARDPSSIPF